VLDDILQVYQEILTLTLYRDYQKKIKNFSEFWCICVHIVI